MNKLFLFSFLFFTINCDISYREALAIKHVDNKFQILDQKNKVIGTLEYIKYEDGFFIQKLEVKKDFQKTGNGSALLKRGCDYFLSQNAKRIWLVVIPYKAKIEEQKEEFEKLVKFYKENGFEFESEHNSAVMVYKGHKKILAIG